MQLKDVYLVQGLRTPQAKASLDMKDIPVPFLGAPLIQKIMDQNPSLCPDSIDEVIFGNTGAPPKYPNISRVIALEANLDQKTSAYTVHRNCASGMEALAQAHLKVATEQADLIFAGGVESMSQMPLIFSKELTEMFIRMMKAKSLSEKVKILSRLRLPFLSPVVAIEQGLTDPFCGLNMGQTAELLAREFNITRLMQDEFANNSHHKAIKAMKEGKWKDEILPIYVGQNSDKILENDVGPREDSSVEGLGKMRPYFDKKSGTVTIGNSCPITDAGAVTLFASEKAVKQYNLKPIARIIQSHFHGLEPERMGLGPALAMHGALKKAKLSMAQMDLIEINEAFAAQVLAVRILSTNKELSAKYKMEQNMGEIPMEKLNVNGGGIALGHPVGQSGARIVITLAHELKRRKASYGIASLCIGGGQGGAMIIENLVK